MQKAQLTLGFPIIAFDTFKTIPIGELTSQQLAGGLRIVMLSPLFSLFVFSISRIYSSIIQYLLLRKEKN